MPIEQDEKACLFCEIYKDGREVIYENEHFYARFDLFPVSPGHAEVIPKRHVVSLFELTAGEWEALYGALSETIKVIESMNLRKLYQELLLLHPYNGKSALYCQQMLSHLGIGKKPDGYNIGNNEGTAAGRTVHHLHIHIIPRHFGDVADPRGGIRHIIPEGGHYQ